MTHLIYYPVAFAVLAGLCAVLYRTGSLLNTCPRAGQRARPAVLIIVTGFAVVGAGAVTLFGALLGVLTGPLAVSLATGVALISMGFGFRYAAETLRTMLEQPVPTPEDRRTALKLSNL